MKNQLDNISRRQFLGGTLLVGSGLMLGIEAEAAEPVFTRPNPAHPSGLRPGCTQKLAKPSSTSRFKRAF